MAEIIERVVGETGRPITGTLESEANDLTIPPGSTCKVYAWDAVSGAIFVDGSTVDIVDFTTRAVSWDGGATDWSAAGTYACRYEVTRPDTKKIQIPDSNKHAFLLVLHPLKTND